MTRANRPRSVTSVPIAAPLRGPRRNAGVDPRAGGRNRRAAAQPGGQRAKGQQRESRPGKEAGQPIGIGADLLQPTLQPQRDRSHCGQQGEHRQCPARALLRIAHPRRSHPQHRQRGRRAQQAEHAVGDEVIGGGFARQNAAPQAIEQFDQPDREQRGKRNQADPMSQLHRADGFEIVDEFVDQGIGKPFHVSRPFLRARTVSSARDGYSL